MVARWPASSSEHGPTSVRLDDALRQSMIRLLVNVDVPELAPAIAFYRDALGFDLARVIDEDVAELTGGSSVIYLLRKPAGTVAADGADAARQYTRHWTPLHLDVVVDDLATATRRALDAGARQEGSCIEWLGSKCMRFADPFGHGFCLIEFTGSDYAESS
jgi:uncharacterized glyoxalase superfamily protein PhnB